MMLWRQFDRFRPGSDFLAWARTVAHFAARSFCDLATSTTSIQRRPDRIPWWRNWPLRRKMRIGVGRLS